MDLLTLQDVNAIGSEALQLLQAGDLDGCGRALKDLLDLSREEIGTIEEADPDDDNG